jgi:WD40 repeat protein
MLNDNIMVSAGNDKVIKIWDTEDFECIKTLNSAHYEGITCLIKLREDKFASSSADFSVKIWDISKVHCDCILLGH